MKIRNCNLFLIVSIAFALILNGCVTTNKTVEEEVSKYNHTISYEMESINKSRTDALSGYVFDIEIFNDKRRMDARNSPQFSPISQAEEWGFCSNFDSHYSPEIEVQIAQAITNHFKNRGTFKDVLYNNRNIADYYLTGDVVRYFGQAMYKLPHPGGNSSSSTAKNVGMQHGIFGVLIGEILAQAMEKPNKEFSSFPVETALMLDNIKLHDRTGKIIRELEDLKFDFYGDVALEDPCIKIFQVLDQQFKNLVEKLASDIEAELRLLFPPVSE